jgi:outer membrane receptor protein involved in Fe transport
VAGFRQAAIASFFGAYGQRTDQDRFATVTTGRTIERADVSANDFHVKASAERVIGTARLELGVDLNGRFDLEALDIIQAFDLGGALTRDTTNVSVEDAHRANTGVYMQANSSLGRVVHVAAGVRGDRATTVNDGGYFGNRSTSNAAASGFGAVTLGSFQGLSLTGQLSRGFRDPVLSDRYYRGPTGRGFITGNPDLLPETSLQFDLATRYTTARAQVAVYVYQYRIADLIERYQTQTDFFFFRNRGRGRLRGLEVETRAELGRGYFVELGAHLSRGTALDDGANLDDVSPDGFSLVGRKQFGSRLYAQARVAYSAPDDRPGPSEVDAPGATLVDLAGGWQIARNLELRATLRNLLNDDYYASPDPRWVYAPGRSAGVTLAARF